jgi:hypothetical protein
MVWRVLGSDRKVEVIVDPNFQRDLLEMAKIRPIWIVETANNRPRIEEAWRKGETMDLYSINKYQPPSPDDREGSLLIVLDSIEDHHGKYAAMPPSDGIIVHGLTPSDSLRAKLSEMGFKIAEITQDGFMALGRYNRDDLIWGNEGQGGPEQIR